MEDDTQLGVNIRELIHLTGNIHSINESSAGSVIVECEVYLEDDDEDNDDDYESMQEVEERSLDEAIAAMLDRVKELRKIED